MWYILVTYFQFPKILYVLQLLKLQLFQKCILISINEHFLLGLGSQNKKSNDVTENHQFSEWPRKQTESPLSHVCELCRYQLWVPLLCHALISLVKHQQTGCLRSKCSGITKFWGPTACREYKSLCSFVTESTKYMRFKLGTN